MTAEEHANKIKDRTLISFLDTVYFDDIKLPMTFRVFESDKIKKALKDETLDNPKLSKEEQLEAWKPIMVAHTIHTKVSLKGVLGEEFKGILTGGQSIRVSVQTTMRGKEDAILEMALKTKKNPKVVSLRYVLDNKGTSQVDDLTKGRRIVDKIDDKAELIALKEALEAKIEAMKS